MIPGKQEQSIDDVRWLKPGDSTEVVFGKTDRLAVRKIFGSEWECENEAAEYKKQMHPSEAKCENRRVLIAVDEAMQMVKDYKRNRDKSQTVNLWDESAAGCDAPQPG